VVGWLVSTGHQEARDAIGARGEDAEFLTNTQHLLGEVSAHRCELSNQERVSDERVAKRDRVVPGSGKGGCSRE